MIENVMNALYAAISKHPNNPATLREPFIAELFRLALKQVSLILSRLFVFLSKYGRMPLVSGAVKHLTKCRKAHTNEPSSYFYSMTVTYFYRGLSSY